MHEGAINHKCKITSRLFVTEIMFTTSKGKYVMHTHQDGLS